MKLIISILKVRHFAIVVVPYFVDHLKCSRACGWGWHNSCRHGNYSKRGDERHWQHTGCGCTSQTCCEYCIVWV